MAIDFNSPHLAILGADDVHAQLEGIGQRIEDMSPIMRGAVRDVLIRSAQENFQAQGRPDRWPDLKESTRKRKRGTDLILQDSLLLVRSLSPDGNQYSINHHDEHSVTIGTTRPGAKNHQEGLTRPQRRFLVVQDEDIEDIKTIIADFALGRMGDL
ncbi:MAG: phage virion morphogenesis protein [Thermoanaerobaculia bacterium]